jgi:hypothetical protein
MSQIMHDVMYGTPAAVIQNPFVESIYIGAELNQFHRLANQKKTKKTWNSEQVSSDQVEDSGPCGRMMLLT